jgi:hypothetical protein
VELSITADFSLPSVPHLDVSERSDADKLILCQDAHSESMPYFKKDATPEQRAGIQAIEDRADECYRLLRLLKRPRNIAMWALLTSMAREVERFQQRFGANSQNHRIAIINNDRYVCGFHFIAKHGKPESHLVNSYNFSGVLAEDASFAHNVCRRYTSYLTVFPMWHKNHERAELLTPEMVRFEMPHDSPRQRQVIAYQQMFRPAEEARTRPKPAPHSSRRQQLFSELFNETRGSGSSRRLQYEPQPALIEELRPDYVERLDSNFRHPDDFQLNGYSLREYKEFYIALLIVCAIHEYICYPWPQAGHPLSESSLVLVKTRSVWLQQLRNIARLPAGTCSKILDDLILDTDSTSFTSLCIHPFVPLDRHRYRLAVAPQFPLASAADENILRSFSYTYPALFSGQNTQKEEAMLEYLRMANSHFRPIFGIELPDGSTEVDVLLVDDHADVVILAELKWLRKPAKPLERLAREADLEKGIGQLKLIRDFGSGDPDWLQKRGLMNKPLTAYAHVHHLLLVRDYWHWIQPEGSIALIDFDEFRKRYAASSDLRGLMHALLRYEWLPIEERHFYVRYKAEPVYGVVMESPEFMSGKRPPSSPPL